MLWEVLEHLQDTSMFFTLLKERLVNGGKLILSIPNYDKRLNYEPSEEIYQSPPPIHLNFFTKSSIREILEKNNFEIESINIKRFPYMNLKSNKFYKNVLKSFLGNYHGSTIYVVAKFKGL
jgi:2-polyprenyl-3-methyl-5-hydroxy-6-metoxy-1,4-benzoquinol methylase